VLGGHSKIRVFLLLGIHDHKEAVMNLKKSVLWGLLVIGSVSFIAGCNQPSPSTTSKPATTPPADGPAAHTTESK
jgi:hypothetical protein